MAKKTQECKRCGANFGLGGTQCPKCMFWNHDGASIGKDETVLLSEVVSDEFDAIKTGIWDPAFSCQDSDGQCTDGQHSPNGKHGPVKTGLYLLAGPPGAGKSTLAMQLCGAIATVMKQEVYYVGAEESVKVYNARAVRTGVTARKLIRMYPMGASEDLGQSILRYKPCFIVIDSINGLCGDDHAAACELATNAKGYANQLDCPVLLLGHVNKEEDFAGAMGLQHIVDATMKIEKTYEEYRMLSVVKSRFGPSNINIQLLMTKGQGLIESDDDMDDFDGD